MKKLIVLIYIILLPGALISQDLKSDNFEDFKNILSIILDQKKVKKAFNSYRNTKYKNFYAVAQVPGLLDLPTPRETIEVDNKKILYWSTEHIFWEGLYCLQFLNMYCNENGILVEFRTFTTGDTNNIGNKDVKYILGYMGFEKKGENKGLQIREKNIRFVGKGDLYPSWNIGFYFK